MLAARWHDRHDIRVEAVELREPKDDEIVVRVHWCGICGTDLEEFRAGPLTIPVGEPHPLSQRRAPLTLGHEVVGEVVRPARDGSGPTVGSLIAPDVVNGCGTCWYCLRHEEGLCPNLSVPGQQDDGGLAEFMIAKARTCVSIPARLAIDTAVLAEPTAVAVRAIRKLHEVTGSVVVIGGGTVGQLTAQAALASGAAACILVDPSPFRRAVAAARPGITTCAPTDLVALIADLPPPGVDAVIECSGAPGQLAHAVTIARPGGTVVALGLRNADEPISIPALVLAERTIIGSAAHLWDVDVARAITWLADGRINADGLITHRIALRDLVTQALPVLADPHSQALKVAIRCTPD